MRLGLQFPGAQQLQIIKNLSRQPARGAEYLGLPGFVSTRLQVAVPFPHFEQVQPSSLALRLL